MEDRQVLKADEMRCPSCGGTMKKAAETCMHCGAKTRKTAAARTTPKPVIGGILGIIAGIAPLIAGIVLVSLGASVHGQLGPIDWLLIGIGIAVLILAFVTVAGSSYAIARKNFPMAIAGGVCAMFSFWWLGIPALVLIALSSDEFYHVKEP